MTEKKKRAPRKKQLYTKAQRKMMNVIGNSSVMGSRRGIAMEYSYLDGTLAHATVVENLIKAGALVPSNDGLFEGDTQTYRLRDIYVPQ